MRCRNALIVALLIALWPSPVAAQQSVTRIPGALRFVANSQTVADNGGGTAATGSVTVAGYSYVALTCSDGNGCTMSVSETGAQSGQVLWIVNVSSNTATFADSSGVLELATGTSFAAAQYEALLLQYVSDRWVEVSRTSISGGGGGSGTVTSVAFTAPGIFSVSGSPVTTSGTIALSLATQSAETFFAGPTSGAATAPTFRTIATADLPVCPSTQIYKSDGTDMVCSDDAGASSGAPTAAQYVTLATDATLTNERVLTAGDIITLTDAGAGSTLTVKVTPTADDQTYVGNGSVMQAKTLPDCDNGTTSKLLYDQTTNAFSCGTDQGGSGVTGPGSSTDNAIVRWDGVGGTAVQNSVIGLDDTGALSFADGVRQTFNPNGTNAGINVGSQAGDPSAPSNGDLWYDSTANELTARINGANVALGSGSGGGIGVVGITIDGAGSAISTGVKGFVRVPYSGTITKVTLLSTDASATAGSIVVDVWKDTYANYAPTDADSITASAPPTLSTANKSEDSTLTGWTTSVTAGDVFGFNVDSATTVTRVTLEIEITK